MFDKTKNVERNIIAFETRSKTLSEKREINLNLIKSMSFLKITDRAKCDFIVQEFIKTKRNIQKDFLSEQLGDASLQHELTKLYKPITDAQMSSEISTQRALQENFGVIKALPQSISLKAITLPQYPSVDAFVDVQDTLLQQATIELGNVAKQYLQQHASNKKSVDTTSGIYSKNGTFYIADKPITIKDDVSFVTVGNTSYKGIQDCGNC